MQTNNILTWRELSDYKAEDLDRVNGITNAYSNLRLFDHEEKDVNLIFYRDRHAWCPYCQKIWLWLEFKKVPYRIKKINMYCYGEKEQSYLNKVISGKLPAIELHGKVITESDNIISVLEEEYGVLGSSIHSKDLEKPRKIERNIFKAWCEWLCRNNSVFLQTSFRENNLRENLKDLEKLLIKSKTGFIDPSYEISDKIKPGTGDIIFIPYLERLNASLCYYKGFNLRKEFPLINDWLTSLEHENTYLGTQGDFHTHSHDLPPQMGGCFKEINKKQIYFSNCIDSGIGLGKLEINKENDLSYFSKFALMRVIKHKDNIIKANPCDKELFEISLRCSLTYLINGDVNKSDPSCEVGLKYLMDRISVPRDMPIISARLFRQALNKIGSFKEGQNNIFNIPTKHRYDQNPKNFQIK